MRKDGLRRTGWIVLWWALWMLAKALDWPLSWIEVWVALAAYKAKPPAVANDDQNNVVNLRRG